ncbi:hypothetical protein BG004_004378 [Podila humilis]|nr:hypothetical protein BG004_004378 [Podila humilis]
MLNPLNNLILCEAFDNLHIHSTEFYGGYLDHEAAEDKDIANNIRMSTHLETMYLERFRNVGPRTITAFMDFADTLTFARLPNYGIITSADVVLMLSSLKSLRTFSLRAQADGHGVYPPCTVYLNDTEFLSIEWATKSLNQFRCPIRVPRPQDHVPEKFRLAELTCKDEEESWAIQKQVYRHLAQQTELQCLYLQIPADKTTYVLQWYSLEITLESGLGELEKLTELEELKIGGLNHSMDAKAHAWMDRRDE